MLNLVQIILLFIVAISGIPVGLLLAKMTKEELKPGKKWFKSIAVLSSLGILLSLFVNGDEKIIYISSLAFLLMLSLVPLYSSKK